MAADGLNHTRTFSGTYREIPGSFGITDNTLAPKPDRFVCPWARSDQPGYFDGGNKFDLDALGPGLLPAPHATSWRRPQSGGIVVEMNLFCPLYNDELWDASPMNAANNVNGVGDCPRTEVLTLKHRRLLEVQVAVTRKIVGELNAVRQPLLRGLQRAVLRRRDAASGSDRIVDTIVRDRARACRAST